MTPTQAQTNYRILTSTDGGKTWELQSGVVTAAGRDSALKTKFADPPDTERLAVAVPESSFRPATVRSKTTTAVVDYDLDPEPSSTNGSPVAAPVEASV